MITALHKPRALLVVEKKRTMGDTTDQVITPIGKIDARSSHAGNYTTTKIYCGNLLWQPFEPHLGVVDLRPIADELQIDILDAFCGLRAKYAKTAALSAEQLDFNRAWELIILASFRKWLRGNRAKACFRSRSRLSAEALRVENGKPLPKQRKRAEINCLKRRFASSNCRI